MIVFHTTYHLSDSVYERGLEYFRKTYIPAVVRGGVLHSPRLQRVMTQATGGDGVSLSVQFRVADEETLEKWMSSEGTSLQRSMQEQFQDEIIGFSTLLEELEIEV